MAASTAVGVDSVVIGVDRKKGNGLSLADTCRLAATSASHSMSDALVRQQAVEGATLRAGAAWVAYPLDVLKTQVQSGHPQYKNLRAVPLLVRDYGAKTFRGYPGVGTNAFLMGALMFGGYRFFDNLWKFQGVPDYWRPAVAGGSIGLLCGFVTTPLEQVKTIMALQESWLREGKISQRVYSSVAHGALKAPLSLQFYAVAPLMVRTGLFDMQLFFYSSRLREWMAAGGLADQPAAVKTFASTFGFMFAGLLGATINYPFDLVKGRMMAQAWSAHQGHVPKLGMLACFRQVISQNGIAGLFRGLPTRSALHATIWCTVGLGREVCEALGVRENARRQSAAQGHSKQLSA